MPIIDVHTHMLSAAYLETMQRTAGCPYTVRENSSGDRVMNYAEIGTEEAALVAMLLDESTVRVGADGLG